MKKRIVSLLLVLCMVLSLVPMQAFAADTKTATNQLGKQNDSFEDVNQDDWYYDAARYVKLNGIFNGTGAN